jgi:hypothetical protein
MCYATKNIEKGDKLLTDPKLNSHIWEAIRLVWPDAQWPAREQEDHAGLQSRL